VPSSVAVAPIVSGSGDARLIVVSTVTVRLGAVLSTTTVRSGETKELPATSRVVTRRS
jgi:hypothetical protein